jgi:hypothetical protein
MGGIQTRRWRRCSVTASDLSQLFRTPHEQFHSQPGSISSTPPQYIKNNRIARVVFNLPHPDVFARSAGPNLGLCHPILTVERFFDLATLLLLGQVPGPMFLSYSGVYMKHPRALVVPISLPRQKNVDRDYLAGNDLSSRKEPGFDTHAHLGDED